MKLKYFNPKIETELRKDSISKKLNEKFPHINPKDGESLNIEFHTEKILRRMWENKRRYPSIVLISQLTGLSERQLYRWAIKYSWPDRKGKRKL